MSWTASDFEGRLRTSEKHYEQHPAQSSAPEIDSWPLPDLVVDPTGKPEEYPPLEDSDLEPDPSTKQESLTPPPNSPVTPSRSGIIYDPYKFPPVFPNQGLLRPSSRAFGPSWSSNCASSNGSIYFSVRENGSPSPYLSPHQNPYPDEVSSVSSPVGPVVDNGDHSYLHNGGGANFYVPSHSPSRSPSHTPSRATVQSRNLTRYAGEEGTKELDGAIPAARASEGPQGPDPFSPYNLYNPEYSSMEMEEFDQHYYSAREE